MAFEPPRECQWCGAVHGPRCPQVRAFEFYEGGQLKRVEFVDQTAPAPSPDEYPRLQPTEGEA